jgi:hypothetical protein
MPIDPTDLATSIGDLGSLDPQRGLARTLQQVTDGAKQLFRADAAGLMLIDAEGQLRWESASDQTAQTVERPRPVKWCRRRPPRPSCSQAMRTRIVVAWVPPWVCCRRQ